MAGLGYKPSMASAATSTSLVTSVALADQAATERLAVRLAPILRSGDVIALSGELGAGKTCFARALIRSLGAAGENVPSPTFTLAQMYEARDFDIWHFDLYRLEKPEDSLELGIEEAMTGALCLIEWPGRLGRYLPAGRLDLRLEFGASENARMATLSGGGDWRRRLAKIADD